MYKLVCIDMDGTLLNSKREISDINKSALKKAFDMGVHIVITTGRIYLNAEYYSDLIGIKSPIIASNGAIIKEKGSNEFIYKAVIPKEINLQILEICNKYKLYPRFHTITDIYYSDSLFNFMNLMFYFSFALKVKSKDHRVRMHYIKSKRKWHEVFNLKKEDIVKCEIYSFDKEKIKNVYDELKKIGSIKVVPGFNSLEITRKDVSKGSAIKFLAEKYKIKREEIVAIGDSENDIEMIQYAGFGVAMGNAIKAVKEKANYITTSNDEDGVAKVINEFIINSEEKYA
ncbi:HAD family phosphatase [Caloramator sp. E03]|uniref:Cof-type HAD-IIB family hydrolase n=1 Tax=Caloramator sp. E03 TaxID=2576307 RepID=UPI0011109C79|nr:Cof-type HAD-IIB family hydrolase [Caloramator sp. E03]QCX33905.1 HAD family phosphatase [Caloramator sp. E03]